MDLKVDAARGQRMREKNQARSYGLTLVVGLPFAPALMDRAAALQAEVEKAAAGVFCWYQPRQIHATVYAPRRGDYERAGPLRREELPGLEIYLEHLAAYYGQLSPFVARMGAPQLTVDGALIFREMSGVARPTPAPPARPLSWLDQPKHSGGGLVCSTGYLRQPEKLQQAGTEAAISQAIATDGARGETATPIERVWLVHYSSRTLDAIEGQLAFTLGRKLEMDAAAMCAALGLA